jgi:hypothetical protein
VLEHHAGRGAQGGELAVALLGANGVTKPPLAITDADMPAVRFLEQVDAPQQGRFARAARPDHCDNRAALDLQRDAPQYRERPEALPKIGNLDHHLRHGCRLP